LLGRAVAIEVRRALNTRVVKPQESISLGDEKLLRMDMAKAATYFRVPGDTIAKRHRVAEPSAEYQADDPEVSVAA